MAVFRLLFQCFKIHLNKVINLWALKTHILLFIFPRIQILEVIVAHESKSLSSAGLDREPVWLVPDRQVLEENRF